MKITYIHRAPGAGRPARAIRWEQQQLLPFPVTVPRDDTQEFVTALRSFLDSRRLPDDDPRRQKAVDDYKRVLDKHRADEV